MGVTIHSLLISPHSPPPKIIIMIYKSPPPKRKTLYSSIPIGNAFFLSFFLFFFFVRVNHWVENYSSIFQSWKESPYLQRLLENKRKKKDIHDSTVVSWPLLHDWFNLLLFKGRSQPCLRIYFCLVTFSLHPSQFLQHLCNLFKLKLNHIHMYAS